MEQNPQKRGVCTRVDDPEEAELGSPQGRESV
jgi:hypothetical protein